jgi:hypothetical protein
LFSMASTLIKRVRNSLNSFNIKSQHFHAHAHSLAASPVFSSTSYKQPRGWGSPPEASLPFGVASPLQRANQARKPARRIGWYGLWPRRNDMAQ